MSRDRRRGKLPTSDDGGFTLIELLVVIVILGILAAVVVFAVAGVGDKGKASTRVIDVRTLRTAEEAFCANTGRYATEPELVSAGFLSEQSSLHGLAVGQGGTCGTSAASNYAVTCPITDADCSTIEGSVDGGPGGTWTQVADMNGAQTVHSTVTLADGRVLAVGLVLPGNVQTAEIYEPKTNRWTVATSSPGPALVRDPLLITGSAATCGSNCNKVLFRYSGFGGGDGWRLFDPAGNGGAGSWQNTSPVAGQRNILEKVVLINPSGTRCAPYCGKVLVIGGYDNLPPVGSPVSQQDLDETADMYDPANDTWRTVSDRLAPPGRFASLAVGLADGRAAVFGGNDFSAATEPYNLKTMEIYTPETDSWDPGPDSPFDHASLNCCAGGGATLLGDGRVLVAGGGSSDSGTDFEDRADVFDPAGNGGSGAWTPAARCGCLFWGTPHGALIFPYGSTAMVLQTDPVNPTDEIGIFRPGALDWDLEVSPFPTTRHAVSVGVAVLRDGRILVAGGEDETFTRTRSTFLFTPDVP